MIGSHPNVNEAAEPDVNAPTAEIEPMYELPGDGLSAVRANLFDLID
jgi:hypothetical protein